MVSRGVKPRMAPRPRKIARPEGFLGGVRLDGRDMTDVFGSPCMPGIVGGLHPGPDSRAVAKKLPEPDRDRWRHRLSFLQDIVKMLARNPEQSGDLRLGPTGSWDDVIPKQRTGMRRAAILGALCRIGHGCSFNDIVRNQGGRRRHLRSRTR